MQNLQENKIVQVTPPGAIVDNAAVVTAAIDTRGFNEVAIYVSLGALDIAMTSLKLQESDQAGTGFVDVVGGDFSVGAELPSATEDNKIYGFFVDLRGKKRYLDVVAVVGDGAAGTYISIVAVLGKPNQSANSATKRGVSKERVC